MKKEILNQGDNGVTTVQAPSESAAQTFLERNHPLPKGWQWVSDGIDASKNFYWFHQCHHEGGCQHPKE